MIRHTFNLPDLLPRICGWNLQNASEEKILKKFFLYFRRGLKVRRAISSPSGTKIVTAKGLGLFECELSCEGMPLHWFQSILRE